MSEPSSSQKPAAKPDDVPGSPANAPAPDAESAPGQLTKEEQWALFEKELKESDWGHQPC